MPKLTGPRQIGVEHPLWQRLRAYQQGTVMNGGVDAGESTQTTLGPSGTYTGNESGQWLNVTAPGAPNTEFSVPHNLGRIPSHFRYISNVGAVVYQFPNTGTPWTDTTVYFKCTIGSAMLRIFIQ